MIPKLKKGICILYNSETTGAMKSLLTLRSLELKNIIFLRIPYSFFVSLGIIRRNFLKLIKSKIIIINGPALVRNPTVVLLHFYFILSRKVVFIYWHASEWHWKVSLRIKYGIRKKILKLFFKSNFFEKIVKNLIKSSININVSNYTVKWVKNKFNLKSKVEILNETIDIEKIHKLSLVESPEFSENKYIIIIAVGSIQPRKGFKFFLNVAENVPNYYKFIWIGKKVNPNIEFLEKIKLINNKAHYKKIQLLDYTLNPYSYMSKCDIFFLPSLDDPFAIVYLEALALGKFIICPQENSGFGEFLKGKENIGFVYRDINKVIEFLNSKNINKYIRKFKEERVNLAQKFDKKYFFEKFFKIINKY